MLGAIHIDSFLVAVLVMIIAGISNWLQQRAHSREDQKPRPQPPQVGPVPSRTPRSARPLGRPGLPPGPTLDPTLERSLRRLLGEELPPLSPRPVAVPPRQAAPFLEPPKIPVATEPMITPLPTPVVPPLATLSQSTAAYSHGQQIQEGVAERLRQVERQTRLHTPAIVTTTRALPSPSFAIARLKHNRSALRQAFVASLIFGPPKALEEGLGS